MRDFINNFGDEAISSDKKDILFSIVHSLSGGEQKVDFPGEEDEKVGIKG